MNILALDLGTKTGVARNREEGFLAYTLTMATDKEITLFRKRRLDRRGDPRVEKFFWELHALDDLAQPDLIVFEDVQFQSFTLQTQLWSSFRTAIWLAFSHKTVDCVATGTLKKFATGHGGATKEMMSAHLKCQHPELWKEGYDDNAIDAIWIWLWAKKNLSRIDTRAR